jgi:hypothetical protein
MIVATTTLLAIAALTVSAGAAYVSYEQGQKAADRQKKANNVSQAEQRAQLATQRKQQVRQERIRRAQIISSASNTGTALSSGSLGATSAVGSLVEGNLGNLSRNENSANAESTFMQQAAGYSSRAQTYSQISGLAGSGFSLFQQMPGTQKDINRLFA